MKKWDHCYPELIGFRSRGRKMHPPEFPPTCPACGAAVASGSQRNALYECGGEYKQKPQIQNHTDYFWGACPIVRARNARDGAQ